MQTLRHIQQVILLLPLFFYQGAFAYSNPSAIDFGSHGGSSPKESENDCPPPKIKNGEECLDPETAKVQELSKIPEPEKLSSETKDIIRKQFLEKFNNGDTPPEEIDDILTFLERLNKDEDPANSQIEDPRRDMAVPPLLRETPLAPNSMQGIPGIKVSPAKPEVYGPPPPSKPDVYDQMMNQNYLPRTEDGVLYEQLNSFMRSNLNSPLKPAHNSGTAPPPTSGKPISPDEESESISTPVPSPSVPSPLAAGSSAPKPEAPALRRPAAAPASPSGETQPPANPMGSSSPMGSSGHGPGSGTPASTPSSGSGSGSGSGSATQPRSNDLSLTKPFLAIPKTSPGPWVSLDEASETPGSTAPTALKKGPKEDPKKEIPQQILPGSAKGVPALGKSEGTTGTSLLPPTDKRMTYVTNDNTIRRGSGTSPTASPSPAAPSTFDNSPTNPAPIGGSSAGESKASTPKSTKTYSNAGNGSSSAEVEQPRPEPAAPQTAEPFKSIWTAPQKPKERTIAEIQRDILNPTNPPEGPFSGINTTKKLPAETPRSLGKDLEALASPKKRPEVEARAPKAPTPGVPTPSSQRKIASEKASQTKAIIPRGVFGSLGDKLDGLTGWIKTSWVGKFFSN